MPGRTQPQRTDPRATDPRATDTHPADMHPADMHPADMHDRRPGGARRRPSRRVWLGRALHTGLALLGAASGASRAHGPTPQKIDEAIDIAAPPAAVWALVGDFGGFAAWNPALTSSQASQGNQMGSTRTLVLPSGGRLTEELDDHDAAGMSYAYRSGRELDPAVLAASSYSARLKVLPTAVGSRLEWRARAYRADTGNEAPAGRDDAAAVAALRAYIRPALEAARAQLERR